MQRFLAAFAAVVAIAAIVAVLGGALAADDDASAGCVELPGAPELTVGEAFTVEIPARAERSDALKTDKWSRVALVSGGRQVREYANDQPIGSVSARELASEDGTVLLGCAAVWSGFQGRIGQLRSYDRALGRSELGTVAPRMLWGAWVDNEAGQPPFDMDVQDEFEARVGKTASLIHWSSPWEASEFCDGPSSYCGFRQAEFEAVRERGSIPFFSWAPNFFSWSGPGAPPSAREIANGAEDGYITAWAEAARDWGHPFFLRFAWEMNGDWFRWGVGEFEQGGEKFSNTPADYVAMWRHVHDVFAAAGADNVTWVWCPAVDPRGKYASMAALYPGDAYVDWTCLDAYNWGRPWISFEEVFGDSYAEVTGTIAPGKPLIIGETASTERNGAKDEWIEAMFSGLAASYPGVNGLLWFSVEGEGTGDWPIESSRRATDAFAAGIQSGLYAPAEFAEIETTPIPPP